MDWKNKCAEYWEKTRKYREKAKECWKKVKEYWAVFREGCSKAWKWICTFAADARVWLRKAWNVVNIWLTKAKVWGQKALAFLAKHSKHLLGWMAVLALKIRKWTLKNAPRLKSWWDHWKVRKWLAEKAEKIREKFPAPAEEVPAQIAAAKEPEMSVEHPISAPSPEAVRVQAPPARPAVRRRKLGPVATVLMAIWKAISGTCIWIYRLRKYIMAVPVAFYAVKLAIANANRLPDVVGLDIQASGEFARMVSRQHAVLGPLGVTVFCLVLVLCSRKPLLPWLISIFTLILPVLIWMTNYYA